jgi:hypothetical protein
VNGGNDPMYETAMKHARLMEDWPKKKKADMPPLDAHNATTKTTV